MRWNSGKQFERAPAGSHIAICYAVIDLGTQPKTWQGTTTLERQVRLSFELPGAKMEGLYDANVKGKPFAISRVFKQSLHTKANLRKFLEGWRGRAFKPEEIENVDPKKFLGVPCRLNLIESEDGQYTNIDSIAPLGKGEKKPKQINANQFISLDPEEFDKAAFEKLPEGLRTKIAKSPEYAALTGEHHGDEPQQDPADGDAPPTDGDDVPF